jgi:hypothetical protein
MRAYSKRITSIVHNAIKRYMKTISTDSPEYKELQYILDYPVKFSKQNNYYWTYYSRYQPTLITFIEYTHTKSFGHEVSIVFSNLKDHIHAL